MTAAPISATRGLLLDAVFHGHSVFAVGESGAIIRSVDSGETWEALSSPTHVTLTGVSFAPNTTVGWAVGHDGIILHTRDGGETWTEQFRAEDPETVFLDVTALDSSRAIAIGAFGVCRITRDGGRTWRKHELIAEDNHLNRVSTDFHSEMYIAGERGVLLHLSTITREAQTYPAPSDVSLYGILRITPEIFLSYGLRGHVYRSSESGRNWQRIEGIPPVLLSTGLRLKNGTIILAGQARTFLISYDNGRTFRSWETPLTTAVAELLEAPNGLVLAFGEGGVTRLDPPPEAQVESSGLRYIRP